VRRAAATTATRFAVVEITMAGVGPEMAFSLGHQRSKGVEMLCSGDHWVQVYLCRSTVYFFNRMPPDFEMSASAGARIYEIDWLHIVVSKLGV